MTKKELYRVLERTALKQPNLAAEIEQLVLMVEAGIPLSEVRRELASRHIIDHKVKQEKMC